MSARLRLIAAVLVAACCHAADVPPAALHGKLAVLSGAAARDCGTVALGGDRKPAVACARDAVAGGGTFRVAIQFEGEDSLVWQGAARDTQGKLWVLYFDQGGKDSGPTFSAVPCRDIRFEVEGGDVIECQPLFH